MLNDLYQKQAELDQYIYKQHDLKDEDLTIHQTLALLSELGELLNELPEIFKYWSSKKNKRDKALEEYTDGIFYLLTFANKYDIQHEYQPPKTSNIQALFLGLFQTVPLLTVDKSIYPTVMNLYWYLGEKLGFTETEIRGAYERKYEINIARQQNSY